MAAEAERQALLKVYKSQKWANKVKKMRDDQVVAIYLRLKSQNKL